MNKTYKVRYQIATYSGVVTVIADSEDDNDTIKAKAKRIITRNAGGILPFGYESFTIIDDEDDGDDEY